MFDLVSEPLHNQRIGRRASETLVCGYEVAATHYTGTVDLELNEEERIQETAILCNRTSGTRSLN